MTSQRTLWVYAHPDPDSLNHHLLDSGVARLVELGHDVTVSDLYAMEWNPVLSATDFPAHQVLQGTLSQRQKAATTGRALACDIATEQDKLRWADQLVIQFPLWWYGMPAILKGWFDRVFTNGFAFGVRDEDGHIRKYGDGGLAGKRALVVVTAGDRAAALGPRGISGSIDDVLWPLLHGICHYTGIEALQPQLVSSADRIDAGLVSAEQDRLEKRLIGFADEVPIPYRTLRGGDYTDEHVLHQDIEPNRSDLAAHRVANCPTRMY